jgi:hypothetical protein
VSISTLRLLVGIFFLLASAFLALRSWIAPEWAARYDPLRMNLGAAFALVFGLLNLTRWYLSWSQRRMQAMPVRTPLQPDPSLVRPELRPEFDFSLPPSQTEPPDAGDGPDPTLTHPAQVSGRAGDAISNPGGASGIAADAADSTVDTSARPRDAAEKPKPTPES